MYPVRRCSHFYQMTGRLRPHHLGRVRGLCVFTTLQSTDFTKIRVSHARVHTSRCARARLWTPFCSTDLFSTSHGTFVTTILCHVLGRGRANVPMVLFFKFFFLAIIH